MPRQCRGEQDRGCGAGADRRVRQAGAGPAAGERLVPVGPLPVANASGARSARTTAPTAKRGPTSRTTTPAPAPTAGARTASRASATSSSACASASPCGTAATRSSRSGSSASPATRATTARTPRSTGGSSTRCPATPGTGGATTTRSAAFPYSELIAENARRGRRDPEFELLDTGRVRRRPLLGRRRRLRQGRPVRPAHDDPGDQRRAGRRHPARAAARSGSATPGHGRARRPTSCVADGGRPCAPSTRSSARSTLRRRPRSRRHRARAAVLRQRDQHRPALRRRPAARYPKDGINDHVVTRRRHRQPRQRAAASARRGTGCRWAGARPSSCGCGWPRGDRRAVRRRSTGRARAGPRPTSSTPT